MAPSVDAWLHDLGIPVGLEDRRRTVDIARPPVAPRGFSNRLHDFAPVFVARALEFVLPRDLPVLSDPIWSRGGIVLRHQRSR